MRVTGVTANLPVADIATASDFSREYLGLSVEALSLGWVARYASADGRASVADRGRDRRRAAFSP
jgi:hypothetical protein